jgi:hypothetical protein
LFFVVFIFRELHPVFPDDDFLAWWIISLAFSEELSQRLAPEIHVIGMFAYTCMRPKCSGLVREDSSSAA